MSESQKPKICELRVWWIPQVPMQPFHVPVESLLQAALIIETLGRYDDFEYKNHIKPDYSNSGGLEIFDGEEWEEWENDEGLTIEFYSQTLSYPNCRGG